MAFHWGFHSLKGVVYTNEICRCKLLSLYVRGHSFHSRLAHLFYRGFVIFLLLPKEWWESCPPQPPSNLASKSFPSSSVKLLCADLWKQNKLLAATLSPESRNFFSFFQPEIASLDLSPLSPNSKKISSSLQQCHCNMLGHVGNSWKQCPENVIFSLAPKWYKLIGTRRAETWRDLFKG